MTLAELGAQLKEDRLALGLMVEDVATRLKVPARILRAIEEGAVSDLPHTVYTRGFIKGYGLIIGYTHEKITSLLDSLEDFDDDFSPPKTMEVQPLLAEDAPSPARSGFSILIKILVVALLAGAGYYYYMHTFRNGDSAENLPTFSSLNSQPESAPVEAAAPPSEPEDAAEWIVPSESDEAAFAAPSGDTGLNEETPAESAAPVASSTPAESAPEAENLVAAAPAAQSTTASSPAEATPASPASQPTAPAESPVAPAPAAATPAAPAAPTSTSAASAPVEPTATPAAATTPTPAPATQSPEPQAPAAPARARGSSESVSVFGTSTLPSSLPAGMHQIVLTAEAECYVHANADGTVTREFNLRAGETFAMPFKESLVLKLGNAGGVRLKYDGVEMPKPGTSGQVKTIRFPPQN